MTRQTKLFPYVLTVAVVLGAFVAALTLFFPAVSQSAQTVESEKRSVAPRIAAWQERIAEEKVYAEKEARRVEAEKAADLAAQQQYREAANERALAAKTAEGQRAKELARARAQAKQKAQQVAAQRQRQQRQFESDSLGYAQAYPTYQRAQFPNIFSAMREMRTD